MSENENKIDFKNHPIVIMALTVAGSLGFYHQIILPIMTAKLQNDVDKIPSYVKQIEEDKAKIDELNNKLQQVESQLAIAQNANLFTHDDPYPIGFGKLRIGDSIENLIKIYEEKDVKKNDGYWSVDNKHAIFTDVTYYFNDESPKKEITHILFQIDIKVENENFLQDILENKFGIPLKGKNDQYVWKFKNELIYKDDKFSYILYPIQKK